MIPARKGSSMIPENPEPVTVGQLAGYPRFCICGTKADGRLAWIDLWGVAPCGDNTDYAVGRSCGDDAVKYARDHEDDIFIMAVLMFMAHHLCHEQRCASRLESGFVDRVLKDYPDVVERMIAGCIKGALTGPNLRIHGDEAEVFRRW
jgi:hypothetical protein